MAEIQQAARARRTRRKNIPANAVNTYDAKAQLSALLRRVSEGEQIVITNHGKPVAKLVPFVEEPWVPNFGPMPEGYRIQFAPGEEIAPVYPDGIPWSETDPV